MLPDVLAQNLDVVFCGTAAGTTLAERGFYYAKPTNKFWNTLFQVGLTPVRLEPSEFKKLLEYRIGLTDLVKTKAGMDTILGKEDFGRRDLRRKMLKYKPRVLCFNGKRAGQEYFGRNVEFGLQGEMLGGTKIFVAPSTSGAANGFWDIKVWQQLKELV